MNNRLLVVRNDKLGDFMLAWPAFAIIKHYWPEVQLSVLVPRYTLPAAELCPWIDGIVVDERESARELAQKLREHEFDAMLTLFSSGRVALAGWLARIPYRLAPATKLAQLLYNHRIIQRRSRSQKPEYAYNIDMSYRMLADLGRANGSQLTVETDGDWLPSEVKRPLLCLDKETGALKTSFCDVHGLDMNARLVFIHPGSGGSANNLAPVQYAKLANAIRSEGVAFVISAGPGEEGIAHEVASMISAPHTLYPSSSGIAQFARTLQLADLFISGSTGPMHLAAALDRPTATFFPRHRSATPLRWQPLNQPGKRLAFVPPDSAMADDVSAIDMESAAQRIAMFLGSH